MQNVHATSKGNIPFTAEEETKWATKKTKRDAEKPLKDWEKAMAALDVIAVAGLARTIEDLLDANPSILNAKPQAYKDNHAARKLLRANRP